MDEIWCYSFSKRIAEGYIPYKDYNMIQTPLFFFIGSLFSKSLILFRIYGALISSATVFLTFYICRKNNVDKQLSIILTLVNSVLILIVPFANYNIMLLLALMVLYLVANRFFENKDKSSSFLFGFSLSVALLIKQNVPAVLIVIFTCILLVFLFKNVITFSVFIYYVLGGFIPIFIFTSQAAVNGSLSSFINYTYWGMGSFSENYMVQDGSKLLIFYSVMITILIVMQSFKSQNGDRLNFTAFVISLSSYMLIYPIIDVYHSMLLLIINVTLSSILFKNINFKLHFIKPVFIIILIVLCGIKAFSTIATTKNGFVRSNISPYVNILLNKNVEKNVSEVSRFIEDQEILGSDVAIIDGSAYLYNIPSNDYNGILDMISLGNMGTYSNDDIILLINGKDIILTNEVYRWHDIQEVREYVFRNYIQEGTIGDMKIYKKP